ncbi:MAG: HD domain-containing protein [Erysipelotrichales bacterium]|nr:HD domain-containing protein [Erysipelotrichales bacterium]
MGIKKNMLKNEKNLSKYAAKDKDAIRLFGSLNKDIRPNYFRDIDRIIYSLSYTRYIDKTQVFSNLQNDHISKRIIHVQLVSKIARTIGRALNLNEDLIEAIALGHDIGHVPFGHLGERILNDISLRYNEGHFMHNVQSVRTLMYLEDNGKGKNLCVQTLDGILCHNGEFIQAEYKPKKKTVEDFLNDYNSCYKDIKYVKKLIPMTMEGCVVRISDIIGYLGRDIEDAVRLGVFDINEIPKSIKKILGDSNRDIVATITQDIINNSLGKGYITMSKDVYKAVSDLKAFNYEHIYDKANSEKEKIKIEKMFNKLFDYLYKVLENKKLDKNNNIYKIYLDHMTDEYKNNTSNARIVIDYISGMTDEFFISEFSKIK